MAPWILVLQLLLMPFVWASPASNLADDSQLCAHGADTEVMATITREKEGQPAFVATPSLNELLVLCVIVRNTGIKLENIFTVPNIFLTYGSVVYLHRHLSTPPPFLT
jgi:hypothetical protein